MPQALAIYFLWFDTTRSATIFLVPNFAQRFLDARSGQAVHSSVIFLLFFLLARSEKCWVYACVINSHTVLGKCHRLSNTFLGVFFAITFWKIIFVKFKLNLNLKWNVEYLQIMFKLKWNGSYIWQGNKTEVVNDASSTIIFSIFFIFSPPVAPSC